MNGVPPEEFFARLRPGQVLTKLFDTLPGVHFFVKDRDSRFMAASRSFAALMGVREVGDLVGRTDYDFGPDFLAAAYLADDREVVERGEPIVGKLELVPAGEKLEWLTTTKIPLFDARGGVAGLAGVTRETAVGEALYAEFPGIREIILHVRERFRERLSVAEMARVAGISTSTVERRFQEAFGLSPSKYVRRVRINAVCHALRTTDRSLAEIAETLGFAGQAGMTRDFRMELGFTPARYRARFRSPLLNAA